MEHQATPAWKASVIAARFFQAILRHGQGELRSRTKFNSRPLQSDPMQAAGYSFD
jgi:hypothetical protein